MLLGPTATAATTTRHGIPTRFGTFFTLSAASTFFLLSPPPFLGLHSFRHFSSNLEHDAKLASFNRMLHARHPPPLPKFNKLLASFVKTEHYPTAISLITQMGLKGITPSLVTFTILINCYCHVGRVAFAFSVLGRALKWGYGVDVVVLNTLIKGLCLGGGVLRAWDFHHELVGKGVRLNKISYGILINGLCEAGHLVAAIRALRMIEGRVFKPVKPNVVMYSTVIDALCKDGLVDEACDLYSEMVVKGVAPNFLTHRSLIRGLCVVGRVKEAVSLLDEITRKGILLDVYLYNILIVALCEKGMILEAQYMYDKMIERGHEPTIVTYTALMGGYCLNNRVDEARNVFVMVVWLGFKPDVWTYNILINGYCKLSRLDEALSLFHEMFHKKVVPNLVTYNCLIDSLCKSGRISYAWKLLNTMRDSGLSPDIVTYSIVLDALCKRQHLHQAFILFNKLSQIGLAPDVWTYTILIDGYCKNQRSSPAMDSETLRRRRPSSAVNNSNVTREKKPKRSEVLANKKAVEELIKSARAEKDHLASFPAFCHFRQNGVSVCLKSGRGDKLSSPLKHYMQNLLKLNMEGPYGSEWQEEEKVKRKEMVAPEAHYIFLHEVANSGDDETMVVSNPEETSTSCPANSGPLVGFVQYRFILEEEVPVLYVYELQLEPRVQGKGLGKFLMQLIELIAQKNYMGAVMLTVQKANLSALNFYISKLRYIISTMSPSKMGIDKSYEILCKTFNEEAKTILEVIENKSF